MDSFLELRSCFSLRGFEVITEYSSMVILAFSGCGHLQETPSLRDISMGKTESPSKQNTTLSSQLHIGDRKQFNENTAFKVGENKPQTQQNPGLLFQNGFVPKSCLPAGYS